MMIDDLLKSTEREGVDDLINFLHESDFYTAPASTKYHGNYFGGLAKHSLNVYNVFSEKMKYLPNRLKEDEIIISSICHDFCKINQYKPNKLRDGTLSASKPYVVEDYFPYGHGEKSVLVTSKYIDLTKKEQMLIRWHMGSFDPAWEMYGDKVLNYYPEVLAFHHADNEASRYLD